MTSYALFAVHIVVPEMPPSNLTGISQDSTSILLSWDEPDGNHNGISSGV